LEHAATFSSLFRIGSDDGLRSAWMLEQAVMRRKTFFLCLALPLLVGVVASACAQNPRGPGNLQFGPSTAEREIRARFQIHGNAAEIGDLRRIAQSDRIFYEPLQYDHSLTQCRLANINGLTFEQYSAGMNRSGDLSLLYIVVYDRRGQILCIETRHASRAL
jgi:hypothetical protein